MTELYDAKHCALCKEALLEKAKKVFMTITLFDDQCTNTERATQHQRNCLEWQQQHRGRITASNFHDVLTSKTPSKSAQKVCNRKGFELYTMGIDNESIAKQQYVAKMLVSHENFTFAEAGVVVNPLYPLVLMDLPFVTVVDME